MENESDEQDYESYVSEDTELPGSDQPSRLKKTKIRVKNAFARGIGLALESPKARNPIIADTDQNPAFHPSAADEHQAFQDPQSTSAKAKDAIKTAVTFVVNPKKAIRKKAKQSAAGTISSTHKPYSLPSEHKLLLEAHDDYHSSLSLSSDGSDHHSSRGSTMTRKEVQTRHKARLQKIEAHRESMHVAWITGHVTRVKVIRKEVRVFPVRAKYYRVDEKGKKYFDMLTWLGHLALWYTEPFTVRYMDDFERLPFSLNCTRSHAERLMVASAPWQSWFMDIRTVYRWENPRRTATWLAIWVPVWYFEYVGSYVWAMILYYTIRNRIYPSSIEHLRASLQRSLDNEAVAFQFGELIDRHGIDDWVDPLVDQIGPFAQTQLNDLANWLEALANFYSWRSPRKTAASLFFVSAALLIAVSTDLRFSMKIIWFIAGGGFFFTWPISSLYPRYRLLVSPWRWVIWDIPTHAEWAFEYLRAQCDVSLQRSRVRDLNAPGYHQTQYDMKKESPMSSQESFYSTVSSISTIEVDLLSYRCTYETRAGRLIISSNELCFKDSISKDITWQLSYTALQEMRKYHRSTIRQAEVKRLKSRDKHHGKEAILELEQQDGQIFRLDLGKARDEAFNYIIGFSRLRWMSLQS